MLDRIARALGEEIIPPDDPKMLGRWRLAISGTLLVIAGLLAFHISWACGWLPGLPGFAMASEMAQVDKKVDRLYQSDLVDRIEKILRFKCNSGSQELDSTLRDLEAEYRDEVGQQYQRPSCEYLRGSA